VYWRAKAVGLLANPSIQEVPAGGRDPAAALRGKREAYFRELGGMLATPVYLGDALRAGNTVEAPAIIEEATTTVVVFPGSKVRVTELGSYHVSVGEGIGEGIMKAAVFHGPRDIRFEEVEKPTLEEGEVLVRVRACGICGSDLHRYRHGSWAWSPEELADASRLIGSGKIDRKPLVSHTFSLENASEAYETQLQEEEALKVILTP
jgi:hypothetical protein